PCPQSQGMVGRQVLGGGLIERDAPMVTRTNIQEALRDLLTCLWRAHGIPKHDGDLVHQSVMDQSCPMGGQEMAILGSLTKERKAIAPIGTHQFCFPRRDVSTSFAWRGAYRLFLQSHHHKHSILLKSVRSW